MIAPPNKNHTLALAGLLQSAVLVQQLSRNDRWDRTALHHSAHSLIQLSGDSVEEIYRGIFGVDLGLRTIIRFFGSKPDGSAREVYQYAASTHQLSLKLFKLEKTMDVLKMGLSEINANYAEHFDDDTKDLELQAELAGLYSRTISHITPRIMVQGDPRKLQDPDTVSRVRVALFSGIRSAFLWHQCGGRRWHLLFNRNGYHALARDLINT